MKAATSQVVIPLQKPSITFCVIGPVHEAAGPTGTPEQHVTPRAGLPPWRSEAGTTGRRGQSGQLTRYIDLPQPRSG